MIYKVKSLLTPFEDKLATSIQDILSNFKNPAYTLRYKIQPTAFIEKPLEIKEPILQKACFLGVISIAIVEDKSEDAHILVAIIDNRSLYSENVSDLLNKFNIPNICCDIQDEVDSIKCFVRSELDTLQSTGGLTKSKGQGNICEHWLVGQVKNALARFNLENNYEKWLDEQKIKSSKLTNPYFGQVQRIRHWQEQSLASFIKIPQGDSYANKTRVDCLLTGFGPEFKPLLVLEIDGSKHETENRKKINDQKKEEILVNSGVPLVRLRIADIPFKIWDFEGNIVYLSKVKGRIEVKNEYEKVFSEIIGNILAGSFLEKCDVPEIWSIYDDNRSVRLKELVMEYKRDKQTTHITSNVLEKMLESIDEWESIGEQLIEEKSEAMAEEHLSRLMLKGYRGSDKLLTFTGSTIDDLVIDEKGASATLNAPNDKWHISIAPIHVKYFGEDLNGFQKKFDSLKPKWLEEILRQKAEEILISEKVPALISEEQLQAFKTYWRRKWSPSEKNILATMVNDGTSFGDMAKRLDRSEYVISIALRQRNRDAFKQWNIDAPILLKLEFAEAIRCVHNSIIPKLG